MGKVTDPALLAQLNGQPQGIQIRPADPKLPGEVARTDLLNRKTQQDMGLDAAAAARAAEAARIAATELKAKLVTMGLRQNARGELEPIPGWKPIASGAPDASRGAELRDRVTALGNMESGLGNLERLYNQDFKGRPASRLFGLTEYLNPIPASRFDNAAKQMGPYIMSVLGLSGKSTDAAAEYKQKVLPFIPDSWKPDETNEQTLRDLRGMLVRQKAATYKELGLPVPGGRKATKPKPAPKVIDFADLPD